MEIESYKLPPNCIIEMEFSLVKSDIINGLKKNMNKEQLAEFWKEVTKLEKPFR